MATVSQVQTPDGISWHVEQRGSGPPLVLVPSGEGDCESFNKTAAQLASHFSVTTFDMPGMSRTTAPKEAHTDVTAQMLADQVAGIVKQLGISKATFYGCSSGGVTVLALIAHHPDIVQSGIVHEVPMHTLTELADMPTLSDQQIVEKCKKIFDTFMVEDQDAWYGMGPEVHARLEKNYVTWARGYMSKLAASANFDDEQLKKRPLSWTIGALTPAGAFYDNVIVTTRLGIKIGVLPSKHFPQVTVPEALAKHIQESANKYL